MNPGYRVLLFVGLACAFMVFACILGFVIHEPLAAVFSGIAAAGAMFEVIFFWLIRRK